jgi:hypothetical protein
MSSQGYNQYYAEQSYPGHRAAAPKRKRRVFLWVFLGIQVLFVVWIAVGVGGNSKSMNQGVTASDRAQAVQLCDKGGWRYLSPVNSNVDYKSQSACVSDQAKSLAALDRGASTAGTAIGVGLLIALWVAVDIILGVGYGIYRLATRHQRSFA